MSWRDRLPAVRGKILFDEPLGPFTWFRVGGPAEVVFLPQDEDDLARFLAGLDPAVPVTALGVGSNTLVRDGGVEGVVVRLGKGFTNVEPRGATRIFAGAAVLDAVLAREAAKAGIAGLEFYRGVPGSVGGALTMNAGCYGAETKDVLVEAYAVTRAGERITLSNADLGYSYRKSARAAAEPLVFTGALFEGAADEPAAIEARMSEITERREASQPIREKTGGSTFKNPPGHSSWQLVDQAGWRGKPFSVSGKGGGAMFSPLHANFLINTGEATAADLEGLGEAVRADVKAKFGVELDWEIKRIGRAG
ncbi:MAG TPA: UDP-N-acetylmuramate dehydrogenase [Phenylobacterium sp.]|uniref:UDP-N-acetylmuramate dehydrogenase n=1 Tax=Phenylobacterium sp. TaxID=1871053 RepID=UPI002B47D458|nr:UDP-N-acetylmuramate dehydrogenase [Phenylobacterium sp.]HKR87412.1 UDP-N-acetylmuramate dehydrogenase [Phenylobacterium sp.]